MRETGMNSVIRCRLAAWMLALMLTCLCMSRTAQGMESYASAGSSVTASELPQTGEMADGSEDANGSAGVSDAAVDDDVAPSTDAEDPGTTADAGEGDDAQDAGDDAQDASEDGGEADSEETDAKGNESKDDAAEDDDAKDSKAKDGKSKNAQPIAASVCFVGLDAEWARVADIELDEGADAWDATAAALKLCGLPFEAGSAGSDDVLVSLAPSYADEALVADMTSGSGWHLFVNGERYGGSASTYILEDGDEVTWRYEVGSIEVSVSVVGPGGTGQAYWIAPTSVEVLSTQSVWDVSHQVFEQNGYGDGRLLSYSVSDNGDVQLEALASLGSNGVTGESWQVFVNGVPAYENVAHISLHAGDSICWYYAGNGTNGLPAFAEKTGAGSQSPQTMVHLEGDVSQAWSQGFACSDSAACLGEILDASIGLTVHGQKGAHSLEIARSLPDALTTTVVGMERDGSLSQLLSSKLSGGQGGRAAFGVDGALYYLDDLGSLVKLELR